MSKFINENTPLPTINIVSNTSKESALAQFYRVVSNDSGIKLTVNKNTTQLLPINSFNTQQSSLGTIIFLNGNELYFDKKGTYLHTVYLTSHSSVPVNGTLAMDLINNNGNSYGNNILASKQVTPTSTEPLILTCIISHNSGDTCRIRFGGGEVPSIPGGLLYKGIWSLSNYVVNDFVTWSISSGGDDGFYKCILNTTTSQLPSDTNYWQRIANSPGSNLEINISSIFWTITER